MQRLRVRRRAAGRTSAADSRPRRRQRVPVERQLSAAVTPAMTDPLRELLAAKPVLLADGAMGTSLFARGLETGGSPELWNLEQAGAGARGAPGLRRGRQRHLS